MANDRLSQKQELLAQHLARTHDLQQAAKDAGLKYGTARNYATYPKVKARVRELNQESVERIGVGADDLVQEIAALAFSDITQVIQCDYTQLHNLPRHVRAAISEVRVRHNYDKYGDLSHTDCVIKMHNKVEAQRLLASITDPKPSMPGEEEGPQRWTGLTVNTLPPEPKRINGGSDDGTASSD